MKHSFFLLILLAGVVPAFSLDGYDDLTEEEKVNIFNGLSQATFAEESEFLKVISRGLEDAKEAVRKSAARRAALTFVGLQEYARSGAELPFAAEDLIAIREYFREHISNPDREIQASAAMGLIASEAPNESTERLLLDVISSSKDRELNAHIIRSMTRAGYRSEAYKKFLVDHTATSTGREFESIVQAVGELGLIEAIPNLIERLGHDEGPKYKLIEVIGNFGEEARAAKRALESITNDSSSVHQNHAEKALERLEQVFEKQERPEPFSDLADFKNSDHSGIKPGKENDMGAAPPGEILSTRGSAIDSERTEINLVARGQQATSRLPWVIGAVLFAGIATIIFRRLNT